MAAKPHPKPAHRICVGVKRVSLEKFQGDNYSFDGQTNKFALLANRFACDIPPELMIEDRGYSGTDFNRPSIKKAQDMIRSGVANAVAFPWVDRFAREVEGGLATIRQFRELGAEVLLGDLGWYSNEGHFRFQMNMFLSVAQYQRDDIADKSRWGVNAKLANGLAHYGAPFGWHMVTAREIAARALRDGLPVPTGKPLNFYERVIEDLDTVRLMGELALAGGRDGSQRGICRELDARGIKTPKAKRLEARGEKNVISEWNPVSATYIMNDEIYSTGIWFYGKRKFVEPKTRRKPEAERHTVRTLGQFRPREEWVGQIELPGGPIWTPDEQGAILEALERNGKISNGKPAQPWTEGGREALLKNLLTCGATLIEGGEECGKSIQPRQSNRIKNNGQRSMWYRCSHRHQTLGHYLCDALSVKAEVLEEAVWEGTKQAVCEDLETMIAAKYREITSREDATVVEGLRAEFKRKTAMRKDAMRLQIEAQDAADKAEYAGLVTLYKTELALLERRIQGATGEAEAEQIDIATIQRKARQAFQTKDPARRRAILLDWIPPAGIRYAAGWAVITILVQLADANCKSGLQQIYNKQLVLTTRIQVAA